MVSETEIHVESFFIGSCSMVQVGSLPSAR